MAKGKSPKKNARLNKEIDTSVIVSSKRKRVPSAISREKAQYEAIMKRRAVKKGASNYLIMKKV